MSDVNDNNPSFHVGQLELTVREDSAVGLLIYIAHAADNDAGENGTVSYLLSPEASTRTFSISRQSGEIRLVRQLDYESRRKHRFAVVASDGGSPGRTAMLNVTVTVADANDNPPTFLQGSYMFIVREELPIGSSVGIVTAHDADSGNNGKVRYHVSGEGADLFHVEADNGAIIVNTVLDREIQNPLHHLTVIAVDSGMPARSATASVLITVIDINDNDPVFSRESYRFSVAENQLSGTLVGCISADDADETSRLLYSLRRRNRFFVVASEDGCIFTSVSLDRELAESHQFEVGVYDDVDATLRNITTTVTVDVLDLNDNRPQFAEALSAVTHHVAGFQPQGTKVLLVVADDLDAGDNKMVYFTLSQHDQSKTSYKMFSYMVCP